MSSLKFPLYFDYNASTPVHAEVLRAMNPYFSEVYANASSDHVSGWKAAQAVDDSRQAIAISLNVEDGEIYFTSGATESINCAIQGVWDRYKEFRSHFITVSTEHSATIEAFRKIEGQGAKLDILGVDAQGSISLNNLKSLIREDTCMVSVMLANNETGVIQDFQGISSVAKKQGVLLMSDITQAIGKIPVNLQELGIDIACISGHKIYGPKGVGVLFMRRKKPRVWLNPLIVGGGMKKGCVPEALMFRVLLAWVKLVK